MPKVTAEWYECVECSTTHRKEQKHLPVYVLKPCPFCGFRPTIEPWHGGPKTKRLIQCDNDRCYVEPAVSGNTRELALSYWNARPEEIAL